MIWVGVVGWGWWCVRGGVCVSVCVVCVCVCVWGGGGGGGGGVGGIGGIALKSQLLFITSCFLSCTI